MNRLRTAGLALGAASLLISPACVERTMKLTTQPPGALAIVNDEEVGITPTSFSFSWYGDYELIFRKRGYQTLRTHVRVSPPWYQIPPIDLIAETLVATTIRDVHDIPAFTLVESTGPEVASIVERATIMRSRARGEALPRPADARPAELESPEDAGAAEAPTVTPVEGDGAAVTPAPSAPRPAPTGPPLRPMVEPAPEPAPAPPPAAEGDLIPMTPVE